MLLERLLPATYGHRPEQPLAHQVQLAQGPSPCNLMTPSSFLPQSFPHAVCSLSLECISPVGLANPISSFWSPGVTSSGKPSLTSSPPQARLSLQRCNHRAPCTFLHHICHNWNSLHQLSVYVCLFSSLDTKFQAHWPCYHHISASCQVCDQKASHPSLAPERSPNPMKMSYKEDKKFLSHETLVQH